MVLIPKKGETQEVGDFRLVSVLNESIKILSKVLVNRLRGALGFIIDDHQSKFLKGRSILESIASAQEVIQFSKRNKIPGFMLKLDFEKAYDTVEWDAFWKLCGLGVFGNPGSPRLRFDCSLLRSLCW